MQKYILITACLIASNSFAMHKPSGSATLPNKQEVNAQAKKSQVQQPQGQQPKPAPEKPQNSAEGKKVVAVAYKTRQANPWDSYSSDESY